MSGEGGKMQNTLKTSVPALDRSVQILNYVSGCKHPPSAAEITRHLRLPRSSAHALIAALTAHGLLHKNSEMRYTISGQVMSWANGFLAQQDVVSLFNTEIVTCPELSAYSLTLTCLDEGDVVCLACHNGNSRLGFTFHMGLRLPAIFAATGKAMLSSRPDKTIKPLFERYKDKPLTPHSVSDYQTLLNTLSQTKQRGYSIDDREIRDGMFCIGAAVFDQSHQARYGIALSMQKTESGADVVANLGKILRRSADNLSQRLGADISLCP